jgi:hypothetical protein
MSAFEACALTAIALQFASALDTYERDVEAMVAQRLDPELYHRVSGHMDEMREYASSMPRLSAAWVEVMIRHFELTHGLWREQQREADRAEIRQLSEKQACAVRRLRQQVLQVLASCDGQVA